MKSGRIIGIIGGILTLVGVFLPWSTISGPYVVGGSVTLLGILAFPFGILAMIFGIIGLILVAIGKRGMCIGALILGILALIMILLGFMLLSWIAELSAGIGTFEWTVDFGIYIAIIGSIILVIGSGLAMAQAERPGMQPVPAAPMPPPQP